MQSRDYQRNRLIQAKISQQKKIHNIETVHCTFTGFLESDSGSGIFILCTVYQQYVHDNQLQLAPSVLSCCWLGLLTCKTHYRVGERTAAWQFVDIRQHQSFDNGWQYVSCGQRQPPLSGASVSKWLTTITRERRIPPDSESGGIPHLFGTSLSPHIGSAWRARHDNNNNNNNNKLQQCLL